MENALPYKCFEVGIWAASNVRLTNWNSFILWHVAFCAVYDRSYEVAKTAAYSMRDVDRRLAMLDSIFEYEHNPDRNLAKLEQC